MEVYFSKTERIIKNKWLCTIAPASVRSASFSIPNRMDAIIDSESKGDVLEYDPKRNEIKAFFYKGFPCVGRPYTVTKQ